MELRSTYSNVAVLMIGVGVVITFSAVIFVATTPPRPVPIAKMEPKVVLEALVRAEFAHLAANGMIRSSTVIALDPELEPEAADAVRATSLMWSQDASWSANQDIPPPGTVLVRQLGFNGERGYVTVVVGEIAGPLSCGITVESNYVWRDGWQERTGSTTMC